MPKSFYRKKVLIVFGTRPEAIKMAPLVKEFENHPDSFDTFVMVSGQHREMLDQVLQIFQIKSIIPIFLRRLMIRGI